MELRKMATTRIAAIEDAIVEIERGSVEAQTRIAMSGLTSDAARAFLDSLPKLETLMPKLSFEAIAGDGEAKPPIAEQLTSPGALRQRRYRERHAALRDAKMASRNASNGDGATPPDEGGVTDPKMGDGGQRPPEGS